MVMIIGEIARRSGFPAKTIRFYEQEGVLAPAGCNDNRRLPRTGLIWNLLRRADRRVERNLPADAPTGSSGLESDSAGQERSSPQTIGRSPGPLGAVCCSRRNLKFRPLLEPAPGAAPRSIAARWRIRRRARLYRLRHPRVCS